MSDLETRALERAVVRSGQCRFAALVSSVVHERIEWERVTLVGFQGHEGCLLSQNRTHLFLVRIHTIAALADLTGVALILDVSTRGFVRPSSVTWYMHDFEEGWTRLSDNGGGLWSTPYRPLEKLWERTADFRSPMHDELDRCQEEFRKARARIAVGR